jgi:hypothetical protein
VGQEKSGSYHRESLKESRKTITQAREGISRPRSNGKEAQLGDKKTTMLEKYPLVASQEFLATKSSLLTNIKKPPVVKIASKM